MMLATDLAARMSAEESLSSERMEVNISTRIKNPRFCGYTLKSKGVLMLTPPTPNASVVFMQAEGFVYGVAWM
jgi:hypothetical protein